MIREFFFTFRKEFILFLFQLHSIQFTMRFQYDKLIRCNEEIKSV